jgi:hypothetical protein
LNSAIFWDKPTEVSEERPFRGEEQATLQTSRAVCFLTGFSLGFFSDFDHGGDMSLRNVWIFFWLHDIRKSNAVLFIKPEFRLQVL